MKALVYNGPRDVRVKNVPDAKIGRRTVVRVDSCVVMLADKKSVGGFI